MSHVYKKESSFAVEDEDMLTVELFVIHSNTSLFETSFISFCSLISKSFRDVGSKVWNFDRSPTRA